MSGRPQESKTKLSSGLMGMKFMQKTNPQPPSTETHDTSENAEENTIKSKQINKQPKEQDTSSWSFTAAPIRNNHRQPTVGYSDLFRDRNNTKGRQDFSK